MALCMYEWFIGERYLVEWFALLFSTKIYVPILQFWLSALGITEIMRGSSMVLLIITLRDLGMGSVLLRVITVNAWRFIAFWPFWETGYFQTCLTFLLNYECCSLPFRVDSIAQMWTLPSFILCIKPRTGSSDLNGGSFWTAHCRFWFKYRM